MDIKEIDILGDDIDNHWYYKSKALAVSKVLQPYKKDTIFDIGAGSAFFSKYLIKNSGVKESWCVDIAYDSEYDEQYAEGLIHYRKECPEVEPDLTLFVDVLEHIDDDAGFLKSYVEKAPKGSHFFISVPAFKFLWSQHDVFFGHKRRYTLKNLENLVENSSLCPVNSFYYFGSVFPLAVLTRMADNLFSKKDAPKSQLQRHSKFVNSFLSFLCTQETKIMQKNRFFGLSAMCIAYKKD